jgi:small subunit ribosomal protein S6
MERFYRIDDRVLKYMTVLLEKDVDMEKLKEEAAAKKAKQEAEKTAAEAPADAEPATGAQDAGEPENESKEQ